MPRTTTEPKKKATAGAKPLNGQPPEAPAGEVLTLAEAAAYLRVPEQEVIAAASSQGMPARLVGGEWRFLKTALQDWLRCVSPWPGTTEPLLSIPVPSWDDPMEVEYRKELSRIRGRDMFEGL